MAERSLWNARGSLPPAVVCASLGSAVVWAAPTKGRVDEPTHRALHADLPCLEERARDRDGVVHLPAFGVCIGAKDHPAFGIRECAQRRWRFRHAAREKRKTRRQPVCAPQSPSADVHGGAGIAQDGGRTACPHAACRGARSRTVCNRCTRGLRAPRT